MPPFYASISSHTHTHTHTNTIFFQGLELQSTRLEKTQPAMAQSEPGISNSQQQEPPPLRQQSPDLNIRASQHIAVEGNEATIHDFLSLCGSKSASSTVAKNGSQSSMTTQDLLQPLQKTIFPGSGNVLPAGFVLGGTIPQASSGDYNAGQQIAYKPLSGGVEMQTNHRSSDFSYVSKAHAPHGVSINKHWQQQQQRHGVGLEVLDGNKKLARVLSEDDDDEDDESLDHGYSSKKEAPYQKFDSAQQLEGKNMDKGLTPRSKHSATEQRRRSKINDRFQMLRQLLPNSNQKRDKASFLLEVIEHIQMLHEKVKKYEAADYLGQLQERTKALPWDRTSGGKEGVTIVSYGSSVTTLTNDIKESADANGYMRYRSSPLRVPHENGITNPDITSIRGNASSLPNRLLQAPACLPSYENNSLVSKPTLLNFTPPLSNSTEEPATPTLFPSASQVFPEAPNMFAQLLHQEEQAAMRVGPSPYNKEEAMALPQLHQAGKSKVTQVSSVLFDPDHERLRSSEQSPFLRRDRRPEEELVEQVRSSPVTPYNKEEAMALPQLHQAGKSKVPQVSSVLFDPDHERLRSSEQSPFLRRDRRPGEELVEQVRSSPVKDMHQMNTCSNSRELDIGEGRTSHGVDSKSDGKPIHANLKRSKGDCRDEVLAVEQGPSAVLGGVVNISSPYSQGLLDTLTRALQSSGVDLAQARMSVQINLGNPGGSALTSSKEMATLNTAMLPVQNKENGSLQESEHPTKRLKVEIDP